VGRQRGPGGRCPGGCGGGQYSIGSCGSGTCSRGRRGNGSCGLNFPDALADGVATGERGGIIVLTAPGALSPVWANYLPGAYGGGSPDIQLFGGSNVLSDNIMNTLKEMLID